MNTRLQAIIEWHRRAAAQDHRNVEELRERAFDTPLPHDFVGALSGAGVSLITEIKRRSPSAGDLNIDLDPATVASAYEHGGAACLSVLTDQEFFGGAVADLQRARAAVGIPILRKDFTVDERDVIDARLMGADAVLLIVAALDDHELDRFATLVRELGLTALFEVHDRDEIGRAVAAGASVIGVNQRNLHTFEIDSRLAMTIADDFPDGVIKVAESGIKTPADVTALAHAGYDAALIGTSLVQSSSMEQSVRQLGNAGKIA